MWDGNEHWWVGVIALVLSGSLVVGLIAGIVTYAIYN